MPGPQFCSGTRFSGRLEQVTTELRTWYSCIDGAVLDGAIVYGVSAWDLAGEPSSSVDLVITPHGPTVTVDDLKVAQFMYLLLSNPEIRNVLDTVTRKVVLILGRFEPAQKQVLLAIKAELGRRNYVPVVFDFPVSENRDLTETVTLLARMARFIVADLSNPASIPAELAEIAPQVEVPIRLLVEKGRPYALASSLARFPWVIRPYEYGSVESLLHEFDERVVGDAERKWQEIQARERW